jgi:hypothetical protein
MTAPGGAETATAAERAERAYRAVDKARRRLLVNADRFREMLLAHFETNGAAVPEAATSSLKALVAAFAEAGRDEEIEAAAKAIVRARSFAYDIT